MNGVLFLMGLSVLINYIDRSNLSIAAPLIKDELHLTSFQLGTLLSAFFWTYACMQIPAGWLVDHFDVKWVFAAGFFVWSAATAVTGLLHGFVLLLIIRVILGIGESVAFPSYGKILSTHFREHHRGFANSVLMAGLSLGPALGILIGGNVVARFGWRPFFVTLGLGALLWLIPWWALMPRRTPTPATQHTAGLLDVLRHRSAWGMCLCLFCLNYALYFMVTWLPFYLVRGRNLPMTQMAKVGGLVFLTSAVSAMIFGKLSDWWVASGGAPTVVRKSFVILSGVGMGIFLIASPIAPAPLFVWMLALLGAFQGMAGANLWAITQILAGPRMVGRWTGVQNCAGNLAGAVSPALTGYLLDRTGKFSGPFFVAAGVAWVGVFSWLFIVGPVEEVNWEKHARGGNMISVPAIPETPVS
jgi:MFS family permease